MDEEAILFWAKLKYGRDIWRFDMELHLMLKYGSLHEAYKAYRQGYDSNTSIEKFLWLLNRSAVEGKITVISLFEMTN